MSLGEHGSILTKTIRHLVSSSRCYHCLQTDFGSNYYCFTPCNRRRSSQSKPGNVMNAQLRDIDCYYRFICQPFCRYWANFKSTHPCWPESSSWKELFLCAWSFSEEDDGHLLVSSFDRQLQQDCKCHDASLCRRLRKEWQLHSGLHQSSNPCLSTLKPSPTTLRNAYATSMR